MITSYQELVHSNILDKVLYDLVITSKSGTLVFIFTLFQGTTESIVPMVSLYLRDKITHFYTRMCFVWATLIYTFVFAQYYWMILFMSIELIRIFILVGLLPLLKHLSRNIPSDPIGETTLSRCFKLVQEARQLGPTNALLRLMQINMKHQAADASEAWTPQQRKCIERFFHDFEKTYFLFDAHYYIIFFPTFVVHINGSGLHLTAEGAIELNTHCQNTICAICQEEITKYSAKLRCNHEYCLKCIYEWLDHAYTCPMCRREVL